MVSSSPIILSCSCKTASLYATGRSCACSRRRRPQYFLSRKKVTDGHHIFLEVTSRPYRDCLTPCVLATPPSTRFERSFRACVKSAPASALCRHIATIVVDQIPDFVPSGGAARADHSSLRVLLHDLRHTYLSQEVLEILVLPALRLLILSRTHVALRVTCAVPRPPWTLEPSSNQVLTRCV